MQDTPPHIPPGSLPTPDLHAGPLGPEPAAPLRVVVADDNPVVRAGLTSLLGGRDDIAVVAEAADGAEAFYAARSHQPDVVLLDVRMPGVDGLSALPHLVQLAPVLMLTYSRENSIVQEALRRGAGGYLVHGEFTAEELVAAVRDIKAGQARFTPTAASALLAQFRSAPPGAQPEAALPDGLGAAYGNTSGPAVPSHPPVSAPAQEFSAEAKASDSWEVAQISANSGHGASQTQPNVAESGGVTPARLDREAYGLSRREGEIMELIASGMSNHEIAATCFISEKTVKNHINRIFAKLHAETRGQAIATWLGTGRGTGGM